MDGDQVHELATAVFQIRGLIKGRTLLPFPQVDSDERITMERVNEIRTHPAQGVADIDDEEKRVRESEGKEVCKL